MKIDGPTGNVVCKERPVENDNRDGDDSRKVVSNPLWYVIPRYLIFIQTLETEAAFCLVVRRIMEVFVL